MRLAYSEHRHNPYLVNPDMEPELIEEQELEFSSYYEKEEAMCGRQINRPGIVKDEHLKLLNKLECQEDPFTARVILSERYSGLSNREAGIIVSYWRDVQ